LLSKITLNSDVLDDSCDYNASAAVASSAMHQAILAVRQGHQQILDNNALHDIITNVYEDPYLDIFDNVGEVWHAEVFDWSVNDVEWNCAVELFQVLPCDPLVLVGLRQYQHCVQFVADTLRTELGACFWIVL